MLLNQKFKVLIYSAILLSAQNIYAKTSDVDRVKVISQSMIGLFSQDDHQDQLNLKMAAAIAGVSEVEAKKNLDENGEKQLTASEQMKQMLKEQFNGNDFKMVEPAFERQLKAQGAVYKSCQQNGKIIENKENFQVPLSCKVPVIDFEKIQMPAQDSKDSEAKSVVKASDFLTDLINKAPRETLTTHILIHKVGEQLVPEMDNPAYFPDTITQKIMGSSEEELGTANQE
ncbi:MULTISPECIES: hypothetical protein [unclassified Acinetobacter]|uniref:hypothetical protein n=1 Tax=unclassified Acinetobacter TaxID=196816 RepID=UPI0018AC87FE|nr:MULTISPECIES: hypothetical protein [unclassified Acinetobacter]MBJ9954817.1 hypothetical protein [Acinetobacter baumannii]